MWLLFFFSIVFAIVALVRWRPEAPGMFAHGLPAAPLLAEDPMHWMGPLLVGSAGLLIAWASRGVRWARYALMLLTAIDLGIYGMSYAVYPQTMPLGAFIDASPGPVYREDKDRIAVDFAEPNQPIVHSGDRLLLTGWRFADGYAGLVPARRLDYRTTAALRAAEVACARGADGYMMAVQDPLPRCKLFANARESTDPAHDICQLALASTLLVERPIQLEPGPEGKAEIVADRPGEIRLHVEAPASRLLFISESFHSGWKCTIDGRPATVLRVDGDFMGCVCPSGTSEVRFEFQPESLRYGRLASMCGLGLLGGILAIGRLRRTRRGNDE